MKKLFIGITLLTSMSSVSFAKNAFDYSQSVLATCTSSEGNLTFLANEEKLTTTSILAGSIDNDPANTLLLLGAELTFASDDKVEISHPKVQAKYIIDTVSGAGEIVNVDFSNEADKLLKCKIINL